MHHDRSPTDVDAENDLAYCRESMRIGSKSFYMASRLLPPEVRDATIAIYAFCRLSDDAVDEGNASMAAVDMLRERLQRVYAGQPLDHPVDRALARVVTTYEMPRDALDSLLEGMAWDADARRYHTLEDISAYAVRVAGSVGVMVCCVMGRRDPDVLARACDLGVAMQFTNIARDVGEDAARGRIYLPEDWMRGAGLDPETWLAEPRFDKRLAGVVERLLAEADKIYRRAEPAIGDLPLWCRPAILMARHCYAEIGQQVRRQGLNSMSQRAVVSKRRKIWMLSRVMYSMMFPGAMVRDLPMASARSLIKAVAQSVPAAVAKPVSWWNLGGQLDQTMELFLKLEYAERERDRARVAARSPA